MFCKLIDAKISNLSATFSSKLFATIFSHNICTTSLKNIDKSENHQRIIESQPLRDDSEFETDYRNKVRYMEKLGVLKPHISWPQYNRIIYPPNESGQVAKNPVKICT